MEKKKYFCNEIKWRFDATIDKYLLASARIIKKKILEQLDPFHYSLYLIAFMSRLLKVLSSEN